ncbi:hypothetical protein C8J57DRAFT_1494089 [Mycena rebaudengoi]|nr:hypothetical protein C8J57DRAFT_1494089 [Mycena rebaudengoi]
MELNIAVMPCPTPGNVFSALHPVQMRFTFVSLILAALALRASAASLPTGRDCTACIERPDGTLVYGCSKPLRAEVLFGRDCTICIEQPDGTLVCGCPKPRAEVLAERDCTVCVEKPDGTLVCGC